jgi:MoaA/NifB/PqqE/SkfB family radical SAM enzyme
MLIDEGVIVKINTVTLKGINDHHIEEVVKTVRDLGCFISNVMPMIPVKGSVFEHLTMVSNQELNAIRNQCGLHLKQMYHCKQCRADAIGKLDEDVSLDFRKRHQNQPPSLLAADKKLRFAVVSKGGMLVDQHFGHASELYIYDFSDQESQFVEKRVIEKYCTGLEDCGDKEDKIGQIIKALNDCDGVITMRIGDGPTKRLEEKGIAIITTYDRIGDAVTNAARNLIRSQKLKHVSGGI